MAQQRAAVAFFWEVQDVLAVVLRGRPAVALARRLLQANETSGLEVFAMVATVSLLGEQPGMQRVNSFLDNNAASGALIDESPQAPIVLSQIEGLREAAAQLSAA